MSSPTPFDRKRKHRHLYLRILKCQTNKDGTDSSLFPEDTEALHPRSRLCSLFEKEYTQLLCNFILCQCTPEFLGRESPINRTWLQCMTSHNPCIPTQPGWGALVSRRPEKCCTYQLRVVEEKLHPTNRLSVGLWHIFHSASFMDHTFGRLALLASAVISVKIKGASYNLTASMPPEGK